MYYAELDRVAEVAKLYLELTMGFLTVLAATDTLPQPQNDALPVLPQSYLDEHWYAAYTIANHEKRVAAEIEARGFEQYLPLYSSIRRWKDRRVQLDMPLFSGYVFVRLALRDRLRVLQIPSVVRFVGFSGPPVALPDHEMEILRTGLTQTLSVQPHPFLTVGRRVRIIAGPFAGLEGILKRRKNSLRIVVSLELIQRSVVVDVDAASVSAVV